MLPHDEMNCVLRYITPNTNQSGFVGNNQNHNNAGRHWRACFIQKDDSDASIEYHDSFTSIPVTDMKPTIL